MDLNGVIRFGYMIIVVSVFLMIWVSISGARETYVGRYPPCYFNPLCSCSKAIPDLGIVKCQDVHLPRIPQTINSSKVYMLHMENTGMRYVEPYFLQSTGLYTLTISRNPLSYIPDEAFLGLERSLAELDMSGNELTRVPNKALRYLQKLRHLDLNGNDIVEITPENWRGLENSLEILNLANNAITSLPTDAFSGLPLLDTIDLSGNNLREIDPSVFRDGMGKLTCVLLSDNQLRFFPYQALQPLKLLKYLDLSYNMIVKMQPQVDPHNPELQFNYKISLDTLKLDYNQITVLETAAFQYFDVLNRTYLDGNPLESVQESAFIQAKIRELYMRRCGLNSISPAAFGGLETSLEILDLSDNNLTTLPSEIFHRFDALRNLDLEDNLITDLNPMENFIGFHYTLYKFDFSGILNGPISTQDLRRLRHLRSLSLSKLIRKELGPDDFAEYGRDLEELSINLADLKTIKNNAFQHVHALKMIDLSENGLTNIEKDAFYDVGLSLKKLVLAHAFSSSVQVLPADPLKSLVYLQELDLSNNKIKTMSDTSFHFLKRLRVLELQDNTIEEVLKGTFQGDIHTDIEAIYLSFNNIKSVQQHTFVDLESLEQLHLDDNRIESLERRAFMNLRNLKRLNLKGNKISTISYEAFQNIPELEDMDMSYNHIRNFEFSIFDQVGTLAMFGVNVSHNQIIELSVNFSFSFSHESGTGGFHSNIKVLDLSFNNITSISKQYFQPAVLSLTHLYLNHNGIANATKDVFGNMPHLQWLDLSYNQLLEIDYDTFRNTRKLQVFLTSHNNISEVSNDLFRSLENLRIVDFSYNKIRTLPDHLFPYEGLERLDLSHNGINRMPLSTLSPSAAGTLCELNLSWNSISSVSHSEMFSRFKSLTWLDLSYNRLVQLDEGCFSFLSRLSSLDLSHNTQLILETGRVFEGIQDTLLHLGLDNVSLTYIPELPLPNLLSLSLAYNALPTIPPEMAANISSLQKLHLDYNDLTAIPVVTHSLTQLRQLSLAANPITVLSNTSLLGVAAHLEELDITNFDINTLENGVLCKMHSLRTLKVSIFDGTKNFNIPKILKFNNGLRNLEVYVDKPGSDLGKAMTGNLPPKLRNITFSGLGVNNLDPNMLQGVRSPTLHFCLRNTSVSKIPSNFFSDIGFAKNLSLEMRNNHDLRNLPKPITASRPGDSLEPFLINLRVSGTKWTCDCDIGWVEVWQRKRRQYLCGKIPSVSLSYKSPEYTCRQPDDDLRNAECINRGNQSLIEILKTEIECGWSSSTTADSISVVLTLVSVAVLQII